MALAHNIKPDRGLTRPMFMTGFFLVLLYAVLIGVLFIFLKSLVLILVIAFGLLFCQYFFSDKIAMFAMHAKEVTPEEAPELHGVIDRLCALADMPKPRVAIADTDIPNAFATGRSPKAAVVCATSGLLRRLDEAGRPDPKEYWLTWGLVFSPDGKALLYFVPAGANNNLALLDRTTGATRVLSTTPDIKSSATFTPDGKTVIFVRSHDVRRIAIADLSKLLGGTAK